MTDHGFRTDNALSARLTIAGRPLIRQSIIDESPVPIGTVPIYEALSRVRRVENLSAALMIEPVQYIPVASGRVTGIVSRGGSILAEWEAK